MAELDLTEAIEAGLSVQIPAFGDFPTRIDRGSFVGKIVAEGIENAAPILVRQVREQIAAEIEACAAELDALTITEQAFGMAQARRFQRGAVLRAAEIARGDAS